MWVIAAYSNAFASFCWCFCLSLLFFRHYKGKRIRVKQLLLACVYFPALFAGCMHFLCVMIGSFAYLPLIMIGQKNIDGFDGERKTHSVPRAANYLQFVCCNTDLFCLLGRRHCPPYCYQNGTWEAGRHVAERTKYSYYEKQRKAWLFTPAVVGTLKGA